MNGKSPKPAADKRPGANRGRLAARLAPIWQFVKFGLVGVMNTAIDYAVFTLLLWLSAHYLTAQCLSYAAGTVNSYFVNKFWTFGDKSSRGGGQFVRFVLLNGTTLCVSLGLLYVLTDRLHLHPLAGKLLVTVVTVVINYAGSKLWVFRNARPLSAEPTGE